MIVLIVSGNIVSHPFDAIISEIITVIRPVFTSFLSLPLLYLEILRPIVI